MAAASIDARLAAAFGMSALVDCDARARLYMLSCPLVELCTDVDGVILGGVGRARCPSSFDVPLPTDLGVPDAAAFVARFGRSVDEPAESSASSSSSSDSDDVVSDVGETGERGMLRRPDCGDAACERPEGGRTTGDTSPRARSVDDGDGLLAALRRAASRNAATLMRCDESAEAMLLPRGRDGGVIPATDSEDGGRGTSPGPGDTGRTWRKDLRLNESSGDTTSGGATLDFLRSRVAQANMPLCFFGGGTGTTVLDGETCGLREMASREFVRA